MATASAQKHREQRLFASGIAVAPSNPDDRPVCAMPPEKPAGEARQTFGRFGEDAAAEFLRRRGFAVLARNVRTARGELDLVALDGDVVVFVEVKARRLASGLEAVDARKQRRLSRLAIAFLARAG